MATKSSTEHTKRQTRLQEATEKRKVEEQLKQSAELKPQKKMFAPRKLIGPHDILVNSNLPKIKLEEDVGCTSTVKEESLEAEPPEIDRNELIISDMEQSDNISKAPFEFEEDKFSQNRIKTLAELINQKEHEINGLIELVNELQHQSNALDGSTHETELTKEQFVLIDSNINKAKVVQGARSDNAQAVAKLTCDLMEKHAKVRILTTKMLKLQDKILGTASYGLEVSMLYTTSGCFVQESFKLVFPSLYTDLQLNDILACRLVCSSWRNVTDTFLKNHPSIMPFDRETHLKETRELELGRVPVWNESPLKKLSKTHKFSDMESIKEFTDDKRETIIGSRLCLDNVILTRGFNKGNTATLFKSFNAHIQCLEIRQSINLPEFTIRRLMDQVKLCLKQLPNLQNFRLVFDIDNDKLDFVKSETFHELVAMGKEDYSNIWMTNTFPKMDKLVSIQLEAEYSKRFPEAHLYFLRNFTESLIQPYSQQLKQLSIFTDPSSLRLFPKLVELSIPNWKFDRFRNIGQLVEKCTIIASTYGTVTPTQLNEIQAQSPKLTCVGFKHKSVGKSFYHFESNSCKRNRQFFPTLSTVLTLELEECGAITFFLLNRFPNIQYIKLINEHRSNQIDDSKDPNLKSYIDDFPQTQFSITEGSEHCSLEITKLWEGANLYDSKDFWDKFPNIKLVTLDCSGKTTKNIEPKLCKWTREGYAKYCKYKEHNCEM